MLTATEFLDIKNWPAISNTKKYNNQTLIIGSVTDGYMPLEEKYKRTRLFLEQMQDSGANIIITTKSDLILRDIETGSNIGTKNQFIVRNGQFLISKIDARNGAYGIIPEDLDGGIITGNFWTYKINEDLEK